MRGGRGKREKKGDKELTAMQLRYLVSQSSITTYIGDSGWSSGLKTIDLELGVQKGAPYLEYISLLLLVVLGDTSLEEGEDNQGFPPRLLLDHFVVSVEK